MTHFSAAVPIDHELDERNFGEISADAGDPSASAILLLRSPVYACLGRMLGIISVPCEQRHDAHDLPSGSGG